MAKTPPYDAITNQILDLLDEGVVPWQRPWDLLATQRSVHGHVYRGINLAMTGMVAEANGYTDPRWITFNQAKKLGGAVRKGERSTILLLWKDRRPKATDDEDETSSKPRFYCTTYRVFNIGQCDGLDLPALEEPEPREISPITACEQLVDAYLTNGGPSYHEGGNRAYYRPADDWLQLPKPEQFHSAEHRYSTLFHECVHSTGHTDRLAREAITSLGSRNSGDGLDSYAGEELVAELGAAFLAGHVGIDSDTQLLEASASYIAAWRERMKADPSLIVQAAGRAHKAVDHILAAGDTAAMADTAAAAVPVAA